MITGRHGRSEAYGGWEMGSEGEESMEGRKGVEGNGGELGNGGIR